MKRTSIIVASALAALCLAPSCQVAETEPSSPEQTVQEGKLKFNITVGDLDGDSGAATKAIKTSWSSGDKINIWFNDRYQATPDLVMTFDGSQWNCGEVSSDVVPEDGGRLFALYEGLNDLDSYDSAESQYGRAFTRKVNGVIAHPLFVKIDDTYEYDGVSTISAVLDDWFFMTSIQVVVTGLNPSEASNYTLYCDNLQPLGTLTVPSSSLPKDLYIISSGMGSGKTAGIPNADGVAFYFTQTMKASATYYEFKLTDESSSQEYSYASSGKTIIAGDYTKCQGIKIPKWKFGIAEPLDGPANCYIVSGAGLYKFQAVKGNTTESVGEVASAEVLWETYGTSTAPSVGDLVSGVSYADGYISFTASDKKGNAVIAAKDASGKILWSWHIWMTDQPKNDTYLKFIDVIDGENYYYFNYSDFCQMIDRNLGATSAGIGSVGALGLLYQWGRKDPFPGAPSIYQDDEGTLDNAMDAATTITWPSAVASDATCGTVAYALANPTTFITGNSSNSDWYYTGSSSTDDTRWGASGSAKGLYDPCPRNYRVPYGGWVKNGGIWATCFGTSDAWTNSSNWDSNTMGMNLVTYYTVPVNAEDNGKRKLGKSSNGFIWYPAAGFLTSTNGYLQNVGGTGYYWSSSPYNSYAYQFNFNYGGKISPANTSTRANGLSVRCLYAEE